MTPYVYVYPVARPPLPVYGIVVVGVGGVVLLVAIAILILLLWKKWSLVKHKARRYSVSQGELLAHDCMGQIMFMLLFKFSLTAESKPLPPDHKPSDRM